jgi:hypothetical protein
MRAFVQVTLIQREGIAPSAKSHYTKTVILAEIPSPRKPISCASITRRFQIQLACLLARCARLSVKHLTPHPSARQRRENNRSNGLILFSGEGSDKVGTQLYQSS